MIELTNAAYFTLIGLSVLAGYALHGIVIAIKKGEDIKRCPVCGSYDIWIIEEMMI